MERKARYIKGFGVFGGVGVQKRRGRDRAGGRWWGVWLLVGWADGLGWVAWAGGYWRLLGRLWAWLVGE